MLSFISVEPCRSNLALIASALSFTAISTSATELWRSNGTLADIAFVLDRNAAPWKGSGVNGADLTGVVDGSGF